MDFLEDLKKLSIMMIKLTFLQPLRARNDRNRLFLYGSPFFINCSILFVSDVDSLLCPYVSTVGFSTILLLLNVIA